MVLLEKPLTTSRLDRVGMIPRSKGKDNRLKNTEGLCKNSRKKGNNSLKKTPN